MWVQRGEKAARYIAWTWEWRESLCISKINCRPREVELVVGLRQARKTPWTFHAPAKSIRSQWDPKRPRPACQERWTQPCWHRNQSLAGFLGVTSESQEFSLWTSITERKETYDLSVQAAMCSLHHLNCSLFVKGPRKTTSPAWPSVSITDMLQRVKQSSALSLRRARRICYLA